MHNERHRRGERRANRTFGNPFSDGIFDENGPRRGHPRRGDGHPRPHRGGNPMHRGGRGRGRAGRGDVRAAVLMLLAEQPMHGYQLMQAIAERTGGVWRPSPGAIYPTISQLEDEGLVRVDKDAGRKLVSLTDAGRSHLEDPGYEAADPFAGHTSGNDTPDLRTALRDLQGAARAVAVGGTDSQIAAAHAVLGEARKSLYLILAQDPEPSTDSADPA